MLCHERNSPLHCHPGLRAGVIFLSRNCHSRCYNVIPAQKAVIPALSGNLLLVILGAFSRVIQGFFIRHPEGESPIYETRLFRALVELGS